MLHNHIFYYYTRQDKHPFPRGGLRLFPVLDRKGGEATQLMNEEDLKKFCYFEKDVFINLFSEDQKKSKVYDCIFLDIDSTNLEQSHLMMLAVTHKLQKAGIKFFNVMFSGSKGFHIYIGIKPIFLSYYREAVLGWLKDIGVAPLIDTQAVEPNRVTRVICTRNAKSNRYCFHLGNQDQIDKWSLDYILKLSEGDCCLNPEPCIIYYNDLPQLKDYDRENRSLRTHGDKALLIGVKSKYFSDEKYYPECMKVLFDEANSGTDLGHLERLELGKFLLHVTGGNVDEVKKIFSKMSDYNESKTTYHLNYIIRRGLKMLGCYKMIDEGICPFRTMTEAKAKCALCPSINHFITEERTKQYVAVESGKIDDYK